jgi:hypothetical protein
VHAFWILEEKRSLTKIFSEIFAICLEEACKQAIKLLKNDIEKIVLHFIFQNYQLFLVQKHSCMTFLKHN